MYVAGYVPIQETLSCAVRLAVQWLEQQQLVAVHCSGVELQEKVRQWTSVHIILYQTPCSHG